MTTITIQNLDDETMQKLSRRAKVNGHSVEEEARDIVVRAMHQTTQKGLGTLIAQEFASIGDVKLEIPARSLPATNKEKGL